MKAKNCVLFYGKSITLFFILSLVPCFPVIGAESSQSFPITTLINSKWGQTPLYIEIAEYLADENPSHFWDFVKALTELETPLNKYESDFKQYQAAYNLAKNRLGVLQMPLLKLVVSMHSLTPRIQTHFQIAREVLDSGDCQSTSFAQVGSELACNIDELIQKLNTIHKHQSINDDIELFSFDHIYPGSENNTQIVIVYGDIASREFADFNSFLSKEVMSGNVCYIVRHYLRSKDNRKVRLSGYGVELHLKSTEYKSQDDAPKPNESSKENVQFMVPDTEVEGLDFKILKTRFPTLSHSLEQLRQSLLQGSEEITQLKAWEFQDLGLQAAAAVAGIEGEEALQILQFTAQNFPKQAQTLLGQKISEDLREEVKHNIEVFGRTLNIAPPDGALFINGLFFDVETLDLGTLVETVRAEMRVLENFYKNKVHGSLASSLLAIDFLDGGSSPDFAIDIRDTAIIWINDIETNTQYRRWPASVMDLLRPTFPGMLRNIRKNIFNLVLIVNPLQPQCRELIKLSESFILHQAPVRLGLVFDLRENEEEKASDYNALVCSFNYITQKIDARAALSFLTDVFASVENDQPVEFSHLKNTFKNTFKSFSDVKIDEILGFDSDYDYGKQLAKEFLERLGFADSPQALLNGVAMQKSILSSESDFEEAIFSEIIQQTSVLQKAVYRGDLTDSDDIINYLMNQPHVMPRLNQRILTSKEHAKFLDLTGTPRTDLNNVRVLTHLSNRDMTATLLNNLKYFGAKHSTEHIGGADLHFLTLWIFSDLEDPKGRDLLMNALNYLKTTKSIRVTFIPNTESADIHREKNLNRLVWAALQTLPAINATEVVLKWLKEPNDFSIPSVAYDILSSTELHVKMLRVYSQRVLGLAAKERCVIANGKILGPFRHDEPFTFDDFGLFDRYYSIQYSDKIRKTLEENTGEGLDMNSDTLLQLYAVLEPRQSKTRFKIPDDVKDKLTVIKLLPKQKDLPNFEINAIVDPASRSAQKLAPILNLLRNILNCQMRIFLIPILQHSDMPVKNFYRYVVEPEVQFLPSGEMHEGPIAKFTGIPQNPLFTQNLQVPENWLVEAVRSVYDLDNIKLSDIGGPVHSEFELEYLLLEGHCFDAATGAPPRGLQVTLGTKEHPDLVDTIVMANLGYFQLKANPGAWELRLREGRSSEIYDISFTEGPNTFHNSQTTKVIINSLRSHVIKLRVTKKSNMQKMSLLEEDEESVQSGIWNSIANSFGGGMGDKNDSEEETINIFSVASGHLYERLLRIMMVSLLKHTKSPVKFWFLKNYLSPQFTDFLPYMAQEYNFRYELVQYKWPRWLHQQTEKQRTIWGYKILFLDVLFPLNIKKIIFVDADAIVRDDIKELYNMDLGGAPYAYTPFCDSRKEMEGFRFWKQGYWRNHLMGRRYHISALYVVDLKRFRKIAAGDRLRGQYQALSQDPNSLANLDQDLPNNMIHQVAIKSLPDEWLWCQTWCSDTNFKKAKVIDLCNNPQTKEAKLTAAQRIVPEWKNYDLEIKKLMAHIEDRENIDHESQSEKDKGIYKAVDEREQQPESVHSEL